MIVINRGPSTHMGIVSTLHVGVIDLVCIERPWQPTQQDPSGVPFSSCVPGGMYGLLPHSTDKHPNTWALVNDTLGVTHQKESDSRRYGILFHAGNWASDVHGCIAPGLRIGVMDDKIAVINSMTAMQVLQDEIKRTQTTRVLIR